jgi:arylsulfatase A-like enzyme
MGPSFCRSLVPLVAFAASVVPSSAAQEPPAPRIRNVVLVVVDTLRADHLTCYGYPRATSPNLDRLAAGGVRFDRAWTAWPETCESMAAMLSGTWCQTNGVVVLTPQAIATEMDLLPEVLRERGFATAAFVTNRVLPRGSNFEQGIDDYVEVWDPQQNPKKLAETDLAASWIEQHASDRFFAWVHLIEPHAPYKASQPERFVDDAWYDPTRRVVVRPADDPNRYLAYGSIPAVTRVEGHDELAYYVARYDAEIVDADAKIGKLLARLDALGRADDTLVIVTGDHGEGLGEHDYFWHGLVPFDETAHVPLIVRAPGVAAGVAPDVVSTVDLFPTILELLQVDPGKTHQPIEGRSLVPVLREPARATGRIVFTESGNDRRDHGWQRSVRDSRFKLVHVPSERERDQLGLEEWQLFDTREDPGETKDVSAQHADVFARLKAELFGWMRRRPLFHSPKREIPDAELEKIRQTGYANGAEGE